MKQKFLWYWKCKKQIIAITVGVALLISIAVFFITAYCLSWSWTGFNSSNGSQGQSTKTLWDWMQLLIIPIVLTIGGLLYTRRQQLNDQKKSDDAQQEATLQSYIDRMSKLLIENNLGQLSSSPESRSVARALTITTARRLDPTRKGFLIQFLYESGLIKNSKDGAILDMTRVDLTKAELILIDLSDIDLSGATLSEAVLHRTNLSHANLERTCFCKATLSGSNFKSANLVRAHLEDADIQQAEMTGANLTQANLKRANFSYAIFKNVALLEASLEETNFSHANLSGTHLGTYWDGYPVALYKTNFEGASVYEDYRGLLMKADIEVNGIKFIDEDDISEDLDETD